MYKHVHVVLRYAPMLMIQLMYRYQFACRTTLGDVHNDEQQGFTLWDDHQQQNEQ